MNKWTGLLFLGGFIATPAALAAVSGEPEVACTSPKQDDKEVESRSEIPSRNAGRDDEVRVEFVH